MRGAVGAFVVGDDEGLPLAGAFLRRGDSPESGPELFCPAVVFSDSADLGVGGRSLLVLGDEFLIRGERGGVLFFGAAGFVVRGGEDGASAQFFHGPESVDCDRGFVVAVGGALVLSCDALSGPKQVFRFDGVGFGLSELSRRVVVGANHRAFAQRGDSPSSGERFLRAVFGFGFARPPDFVVAPEADGVFRGFAVFPFGEVVFPPLVFRSDVKMMPPSGDDDLLPTALVLFPPDGDFRPDGGFGDKQMRMGGFVRVLLGVDGKGEFGADAGLQ